MRRTCYSSRRKSVCPCPSGFLLRQNLQRHEKKRTKIKYRLPPFREYNSHFKDYTRAHPAKSLDKLLLRILYINYIIEIDYIAAGPFWFLFLFFYLLTSGFKIYYYSKETHPDTFDRHWLPLQIKIFYFIFWFSKKNHFIINRRTWSGPTCLTFRFHFLDDVDLGDGESWESGLSHSVGFCVWRDCHLNIDCG
jgi:hypothetical protein